MSPESDRSYLFSVRVWKAVTRDENADESVEYRGQIQSVLNGEIRHFRSWTTLIAFFVDQVEQQERPIDS